MTVFKSRDSWRAVVYVNGQKVADQAGFEKKGQARDWHDEQKRKYKDGDGPETPRTFEELLERFEKFHLPNLRQGSRVRYENELRLRIAPFFRYMRLQDVTQVIMEDFKHKISKDLKPKSVNMCLTVLKLMLSKAVKWGMLAKHPGSVDQVSIPRVTYEWWDKKEYVSRFLKEAETGSKYYPIYLLALYTGMRYGEILGLCKGDIDFGAGTIHIHRQWLETQKTYGPPKHNQERWISFDPDGDLARVLWDTCSKSKSDIVFVSSTGKHPAYSKVAQKCFKTIQHKAKVPEISFHGLRHSFASWYMREHDNVWDLKALLGHTDIKTTMRYAHHSQRAKLQALNIGEIFAHKSLSDSKLKVVGV